MISVLDPWLSRLHSGFCVSSTTSWGDLLLDREQHEVITVSYRIRRGRPISEGPDPWRDERGTEVSATWFPKEHLYDPYDPIAPSPEFR